MGATEELVSLTPIATPVLQSSLDYFITILRSQLPTNLIQAQRDYF